MRSLLFLILNLLPMVDACIAAALLHKHEKNCWRLTASLDRKKGSCKNCWWLTASLDRKEGSCAYYVHTWYRTLHNCLNHFFITSVSVQTIIGSRLYRNFQVLVSASVPTYLLLFTCVPEFSGTCKCLSTYLFVAIHMCTSVALLHVVQLLLPILVLHMQSMRKHIHASARESTGETNFHCT